MDIINSLTSTFRIFAIFTSVSNEGCASLVHQREIVASLRSSIPASHFPERFCSTNTTFNLLICFISRMIDVFCKDIDCFWKYKIYFSNRLWIYIYFKKQDILYEKCNYNLRLFFFLFRASGGVCSFGIFGLNEKSVPDEIKGIRELKRMLFFDCCLDWHLFFFHRIESFAPVVWSVQIWSHSSLYFDN